MEILTKSAEETKKAGQRFAVDLIDKSGDRDAPVVLALMGDLGSGKTTFTQGLAKGLGMKSQIISPSYILMRKYDIGSLPAQTGKKQVVGNKDGFKNFYHIDLYRLDDNVWNEVKNLGIEEIWSDPENIVVIEWADKITKHLPEYSKRIDFEMLDEDQRRIKTN